MFGVKYCLLPAMAEVASVTRTKIEEHLMMSVRKDCHCSSSSCRDFFRQIPLLCKCLCRVDPLIWTALWRHPVASHSFAQSPELQNAQFLGHFGTFWVIFRLFWVIFRLFWVIFRPFFGANFFWPKMQLCYFYYFFHLWC